MMPPQQQSASHSRANSFHSRQGSFGLPRPSLSYNHHYAPRKSTILNCRNIILVAFSVAIVILLTQSVNDHAKDRVMRLTEVSLQRWRESSAANAICANVGGGGGPGDESAEAVPGTTKSDGGVAAGSEFDDRLKKQREQYKHAKEAIPVVPGFGAISDERNDVRNRFLVPVYACNEQETGSQMHVRQLLHLSKTINRTLVLPNWGFGAPSISNCRPYSFDTIYEVESANEAGLWNVPFPTWWDYVWRDDQSYPIESKLAVIFDRAQLDRVSEIVADDDEQVLADGCIESEPFEFVEMAQYIATRDDEKLAHLAQALAPSYDVETLFVHFGFCGQLRDTPDELDPLLQKRPTWGLWSGRSWPQFNYSSSIHDIVTRAQSTMPEKYAAMQWRMELKKPETLIKCSDMFAETIISEMRERGLDTIYVASDMPIDDDTSRSKSASFNAPEVKQAKESIDHLVYRLREASFKVHTWDTVRPDDMDMELSKGASGIFDRLMLGGAERLYAGNIHCAFKSSYLGSIQTLRQDRIGDPTETDWEKLGMKWVGKPIDAEFWWPIKSDEELEEEEEKRRKAEEDERRD